MPKFSANLTMMFNEVDFLGRFERAAKAGISTAVFDRGGYAYHGRVAALADGAREGGLAL